jgi:hypothetical protein
MVPRRQPDAELGKHHASQSDGIRARVRQGQERENSDLD